MYGFSLSFSHYNFENTATNFEKDVLRKESLTYRQDFKRLVFGAFCSTCIFCGANSL